VALAPLGFLLWVYGHYLKARREESITVLRKGLPAEAEITGYAPHLLGATVQFRFRAQGREHPITVMQRLPRGRKFIVGDQVAIRYLPAHPHISVIDPGAAQTSGKP
jgi:hypothetical protein